MYKLDKKILEKMKAGKRVKIVSHEFIAEALMEFE